MNIFRRIYKFIWEKDLNMFKDYLIIIVQDYGMFLACVNQTLLLIVHHFSGILSALFLDPLLNDLQDTAFSGHSIT